ncbi:hypothetical protein JKF63_01504 [Porcisia hertigi]|uniref:Uncharacterized protein n=1 Tax=Porcisia hertigi TaxID=2761500 RepID=A0A836HJW3_9TRYP|nr:hypothetical protein JKF63_01504 [Porcisia hertigi]
MSLFERPHRLKSVSSVVIGLKPEMLREFDDYAVWMEKLHEELLAVYGMQATESEVLDITYATSDNPTHFSSRITQDVFARLRDYKMLCSKIDSISTQLKEETQRRDLTETMISQNEEGGKSLRQQQRELRNLNASIAELTKQEAELRYELSCLSQQVANVFKAEAIRVSLV